MGYVKPADAVTGAVAPASMWNTGVRDNFETAVLTLRVRKPSDESVVSTTTVQNDDHLKLTMGTNQTWFALFVIFFVGNSAGDIKFAFTCPASGTIMLTATGVQEQAGAGTFATRAWNASGDATDFSASTTIRGIVIQGVATTAGTAGDLQMQFAQSTSDATNTTVKANSTLWAANIA